jgi:hypothetical protein
MNQRATFRAVVISASLLALAAPIVDLIEPTLVFGLGRTPTGAHPPEGWSPAVIAAGLLTLLSYVVGFFSAVGLLFLKRLARIGAAVVSITILLAHLPIGEMSYSGASFSVGLASYGLWVWALSIAYLGDLRGAFT